MNFHSTPNIYASQVHLKVTELHRALTFYKDILGFQVLNQNGNTAVLTTDGETPLITITEPENVTRKEPRTTGLYHFAILLPRRADLAVCLKHLVDSRYPLQGASDHLVSEALYLADPDGNGIEIYTDRSSEQWDWSNGYVKMDTLALDVEGLLSELNGQQWSGMPEGTIMGHIHLHVSNLQEAEKFYCEGLGFDIVTRYGGQALFISTGGYHHHIGLNTWNGIGAPAPSEKSVGLDYYTLQYPSKEEREQTLNRLQKLNYMIEKDRGGIFIKDPSGTKIFLKA